MLLDAVVTTMKYKKSIIDNSIYTKVLYDGTMSYFTVSADDVLNNTNKETAFTELKKVLESEFEIKFWKLSVPKYSDFRIFQYPLGFSVDRTDQIMDLVNELSPTGKFRKVDAKFWTDLTYENKLMFEVPLTGNALLKG